MKKKTLALFAALVLAVGCIVGGTLAWLTDKTDSVVNTFTTSDIDVTLTESQEEYKMIPGWTIHKDPKAAVAAGSEECYLFVKLEKSGNFDDFMTYEIADGWTALTGVDGVYYRQVATANMGTAYSVLKNDQVSVNGTVTKEEMNNLTTDTYPTLTVTAYASQMYKNNDDTFTAAEAWKNAQPVTP